MRDVGHELGAHLLETPQLGEVVKHHHHTDLFGAQVQDLPDIWERLVENGFESGHAYGKSLRTVKSCVGSTWCRYGVRDSVGFAIEIENRYKGIRSPHKIKMAVSGCTRECAEAQSKDVGLIAVEGGYNVQPMPMGAEGAPAPPQGEAAPAPPEAENATPPVNGDAPAAPPEEPNA